MGGDLVSEVSLAAARLLWYAGVLVVLGTSAFRLLVPAATSPRSADLQRMSADAGVIGAGFLVAGALARLYAQTYAYFGVDEGVTPALLLEVATDLPPWSTGWMLQFAAALVSLVSLGLARGGLRAGWAGAHAGAAGVAASAPLTGHAVAQEGWYALPVALQAGHVLGAGVWIGGLSILLLVAVRAAGRPAGAGPAGAAVLVHGFSPIALTGALLLGVTGAGTTLLYLNAVRDLWTTGYGRLLLLKVMMFGAVAAVGFVNWRRVRPRVATPAGLATLRRTAALELGLAAVVLALTAVLVGLPQPGR